MKKYKKIYVEITNICNLKCEFCPDTKRKKQHIEVDDFRYTLNKIKPYTKYIYLHLKGEPLIHPHLKQLLEISKEEGFKVNITTNGTLIGKLGDMLSQQKALRQINFSLHSFDGNSLNKITKEEYIKDIFEFIRLIEDTNMIVSLRLWNLNKKKSNDNNDEILRSIEQEFNLDYNIKDVLDSENGIKIRKNLYLNQDYEFKWPDLNENPDDGVGFCYGLRDHLGILVDGTVVPCCLDGEGIINLGNIYKTDFKEIISSNRATKIYDGFSNRQAVEELCTKCGFRQKFNK